MKIILCSLICLCLCGCSLFFGVVPEEEPIALQDTLTLTNPIFPNSEADINAVTQAFSKDQIVHVYGGGELEVNLDSENYAIYDRAGKIICDTLPDFIIIKQKGD